MLLTVITVIVHLVLGAEPAKNAADHRLDTALEVRRHSPAGDSESAAAANGHSRRQPARARRAFEAQARSSVWATTRISGNHFCFRHRLHACAAPAADSDCPRVRQRRQFTGGPGGGGYRGRAGDGHGGGPHRRRAPSARVQTSLGPVRRMRRR